MLSPVRPAVRHHVPIIRRPLYRRPNCADLSPTKRWEYIHTDLKYKLRDISLRLARMRIGRASAR